MVNLYYYLHVYHNWSIGKTFITFFAHAFSMNVKSFALCFLFVRIAVCMAYYGLALNSDGLGSERGILFYFFMQCLMDIPGFLFVVLLIDRIGRRRLLISCMLIGGVACIATMFLTVYGGKGNTNINIGAAVV